ncbi:MAG: glycosyl hydrolase family 18 protein [Coxiellaceae bacterium]|nr:glycosyl hydrolase family 18 protein [Coxiellaceae bacterium]
MKIKIAATAILSIMSIGAMASTVEAPKNVVGFFQSYDAPNAWYFNTPTTQLSQSGYTMLIDAFWVNYPYCWGDGSGQPGKGSPIPECHGVKDAPGPGLTNSIDTAFWDNYQGGAAPSQAGDAYNTYWTSLHTTGPQLISHLRGEINTKAPNVKLLASIGGWNMGGSATGQPLVPKLPEKPAWAALISQPDKFAQAMESIAQLTDGGVRIYNGIDLDVETLYADGCEGGVCQPQDEQKTIDDLAQGVVDFVNYYKAQGQAQPILSMSPRASDIYCAQKYCSWHDASGYGFVGKLLQKLASEGVYFNDINPQFYNDNPARNIPNNTDPKYTTPTIGDQVPEILTKLHDIVGDHSEINVGVLSQTDQGASDTGGAPTAGNPGVAKAQVPALWHLLQTDPAIQATGVKISGLMTWAANLAFSGALPGHVRSTTSTNVVPYNWGAGPYTMQ